MLADFPCEAPGWKSCYLPPGATVRKTPALISVQLDDHAVSDSGAQKLGKGKNSIDSLKTV